MKNQMLHFQFRLRPGASIGPAALRRLWSSACGCEDVTVSRESTRTPNDGAGYRYFLWGPAHGFDGASVETRLLATLRATFPNASVRLFRLDAAHRIER